jgi:hypothetical protein
MQVAEIVVVVVFTVPTIENLAMVQEKLRRKKMRRLITSWLFTAKESKIESRLISKLYPSSRSTLPGGAERWGRGEEGDQGTEQHLRNGRAVVGSVTPHLQSRQQSMRGVGAQQRAERGAGRRLPGGGMAGKLSRKASHERCREHEMSKREKVNELLALYQTRELPLYGGKLKNTLL